jgi:hypothetical protein
MPGAHAEVGLADCMCWLCPGSAASLKALEVSCRTAASHTCLCYLALFDISCELGSCWAMSGGQQQYESLGLASCRAHAVGSC